MWCGAVRGCSRESAPASRRACGACRPIRKQCQHTRSWGQKTPKGSFNTTNPRYDLSLLCFFTLVSLVTSTWHHSNTILNCKASSNITKCRHGPMASPERAHITPLLQIEPLRGRPHCCEPRPGSSSRTRLINACPLIRCQL